MNFELVRPSGILGRFAAFVHSLSTWSLVFFGGILLALVNISVAIVLFLGFGNGFGGSDSYTDIAANVVRNGIYSLDGVTPTAYRPPAYPFFLVPLIWVFGDNYGLAAIILQGALNIGCGLLLLLISLRISNNRLGVLVSLFLYAIHFQFHILSLSKNEAILFAFLLMLFFYFLVAKRAGTLQVTLLPFIAGLAYLTRPTGVLLFPVLVLFWLAQWKRIGTKKLVTYVLVSSGIALALVAPWQMYVLREFSVLSFLPSSTSGGNLYKGNNPNTDTYYPFIDVDKYSPWMREFLRENGISLDDEVERDHFLRVSATAFIRDNPALFVRRGLTKVLALYSPIPIPIGRGDLVMENGEIKMSNFRLHPLWQTIPFTLSSAVILSGALLFCKNLRYGGMYRSGIFYIVIFMILFTLTHAITFSQTRFRLPIDPLLMVFAGEVYARYLPASMRGIDRGSRPESRNTCGETGKP
jgi:4-amino-4-deoxy-L-arabinose transferase-like glycosyltransferase